MEAKEDSYLRVEIMFLNNEYAEQRKMRRILQHLSHMSMQVCKTGI